MASETEAVVSLVEKSLDRPPRIVEVERGDHHKVGLLLIPNGYTAHETKVWLDRYLPRPERRKGTASHDTLQSFNRHVQRFADDDSALFAAESDRKLTCVFNYNRRGPTGEPAWCDHRAEYEFPVSDEWELWTSRAEPHYKFGQADFAAFIEDRLADIADPSSAFKTSNLIAEAIGVTFAGPRQIMDLARGLSIKVNSKVANHVNLATGEGEIHYQTEHSDATGAPLKVPGAFLLSIPVFKNSPVLYQVPVRLRYRVADGRVFWTFGLYRTDLIFNHAFTEACQNAQAETKLTLFFGSPETSDE